MSNKDYALIIVKKLVNAGYTAYFAGGWVRDYVMGHPSEDIDIATNASPQAIIELFPQTVQVGLAFGVVIVIMGGHQFEVATFRKDLEYTSGRRPSGIEFSSPEEDALRRDFTINGLFYDPLNDTIYDYVGGISDIKKGIIRAIGNPEMRFMEDRLRMIRAVRFHARFNFEIENNTRYGIKEHAHTLLPAVAMERIWQELNKMVKSNRFSKALLEMHALGLLPTIFPTLKDVPTNIIKERIACFEKFPANTPVILYLMELFPEMQLNELLEISQYLKTSLQEGKLLEFAYRGKHLILNEEENSFTPEWAHFYADRFFNVCLNVIAARYPEEKRVNLLDTHYERRDKMLPHIQRIIEKKPLVTAKMLQDEGILPSKEMGKLLKEAENLAILYDLHDPIKILELLKKSILWPKKF